MKISIRFRFVSMDERNAIHNMMKYQNFLIQTVASTTIKIQIKVVLFIIVSLFYFHKFFNRLSFGSHFVAFKFQPNSKRRSQTFKLVGLVTVFTVMIHQKCLRLQISPIFDLKISEFSHFYRIVGQRQSQIQQKLRNLNNFERLI